MPKIPSSLLYIYFAGLPAFYTSSVVLTMVHGYHIEVDRMFDDTMKWKRTHMVSRMGGWLLLGSAIGITYPLSFPSLFMYSVTDYTWDLMKANEKLKQMGPGPHTPT